MITLILIDLVTFGLFGYGAYRCAQTFKKTGNKGYGVLVVYFALSTLLAAIGKLDDGSMPAYESAPGDNAAKSEEADVQPVNTNTVSLPIMTIILVTGVALVLKDDPRTPPKEDEGDETAQNGAGEEAGPAQA